MKKIRYIVTFISIVLIAYGILVGIRSLQHDKIANSLEGLEMTNGLLNESIRFEGENYLIPPDQIYDAGTDAQAMPSIDAADFISVAAADSILADEVHGIILAAGDNARFYSYQIMNWHEVVNDSLGEEKIAVTHCSLCRSSVVYNRTVNGQELNFEISGKIYNNNTLLQDRETGSLWLQATGLAISGELIGTKLEIIPTPVMTWGDFKEAFPVAVALSSDTGFERDYARHPYLGYDSSKTIYFPLNHTDNSLTNKWIINGVNLNNEQIVFSEKILEGSRVQHETLDDINIVALHDEKTGVTTVLLPISSSGEELTFTYNREEDLIVDESGSSWTPFGLAIDGPLKGERLEQIPAPDMFWFCWSALHPDTTVSQIN